MEKIKMRCHFSIIFESLWQFWAVIVIMLFNQIETVIDLIKDFGESGIRGILQTGGIWGLAGLVAVTLIVLGFQFLRWRKTWITLDGNLIIIERNTLNKYKNTIALENVSAVNVEQNLFERIVGTYRIKMDTSSMTTANKTDVSIVFRKDKAVAFRKEILTRMNQQPKEDAAFTEGAEGTNGAEVSAARKIYHYTPMDMAKHCFFSADIFSLLVTLAGIVGFIWYISEHSLGEFINFALGGAIAAILMVLGAAYGLIKKFITYYDFTVYREGIDLHIRCGLIKLRSYTIPVDKITSMQIIQPAFSRMFKRYQAKVVTVGIGDENGESSNLTMAVPKERFMEQMMNLVPEYVDENVFEGIIKEEPKAVVIKLAKYIKWNIIIAAAIFAAASFVDFTWLYFIPAGLLVSLYIGSLFFLSHRTAGYRTEEDRAVFVTGKFTRKMVICLYKKMQIIKLSSHPLARKHKIVCGSVSLLNSFAEIPYINEDLAFEISEKMQV